MRRVIILVCLFLSANFMSFADEGMWIPLFIKNNESHMKSLGMKISAEDIYSVNNNSLKDAVVRFGRGCTGMLISPEGLIMTNYHCGYSQIQALSSLENDYLKDGFWASKKDEELSNSGLSVTFLVSMEDVTEIVLEGVSDEMPQSIRNQIIENNIKTIVKNATENTHFEAEIKDYYNGNQYFLFIHEVFKDIRLVGTPPSSIGKFGGDTDNWMWPRHTGDFAIFRIYANEDNKPAEYSTDNVPYQPKKFLPISIAGVEEGDFTFVYGFPGTTNQYATSYEINLIKHTENPISIKMRDMRLEIIGNAMKESDLKRIQYAAKQASIANGWKKWIGENRGLKRLNTIENKKNYENAFSEWAKSTSERQEKYAGILPLYNTIYEERKPTVSAFRYFIEAGLGSEIIRFAYGYTRLVRFSETKNHDADELKALIKQFKSSLDGYFKNYDVETDKKLFTATMKAYYNSFSNDNAPAALKTVNSKKYKGSFEKFADDIFENSIFSSQDKLNKLLESNSIKKIKSIDKDPAYVLAKSMYDNYFNNVYPLLVKHDNILDSLNRIYMQGLIEWDQEKIFYPDANLTLRISYGNVKGYEPADAASYRHFTKIEGIFEKEKLGYDDYKVHPTLRTLFQNRDFGRYESNGTLPICFIASNHTTGGNSGSPVINGNGELVGINFDRNWEGTMSDLNYDPIQGRNITLDMRYAVFIIDKFAGSEHIMKELKIIGK